MAREKKTMRFLEILSGMPKTKRDEIISGYLFITPFFILLIVFIVWVFLNNFFISLTDSYGANEGNFIGLSNFKGVLTNSYFWRTVLTSFKYAVVSVALQIPVSFILANILNGIPFKRWRMWLRASFFLPYLFATVVAGVLFGALFAGDPGMVNWVLKLLHLPHQFYWFRDRSLHFPMIIIITFWQWIGFQAVYFLANLQAIDASLYEASRMDGASAVQIFFKITLPLMRPAVTFMIVISMVSFLMLFDLVTILNLYTENTMSMLQYIYSSAFGYNFYLGWGAAAGFVAFFIVFAVSLLQIRFLGLGKAGDE